MQSCRDVAYLISSDGLEHAGWPTRLLTRLHLRLCKHCRRYATELANIGRIGREAGRAESVDPKTVERLDRPQERSWIRRSDHGLRDGRARGGSRRHV